VSTQKDSQPGFQIRLRNFEGPFDLLLQLISQQQLDVTEVALHTVTDDFIAYTKSLGVHAGLDQITDFLVVAATLLDLKAARLLPHAEVDDIEDLQLLESRDLLFARLLQYRAYMQVAQLFAELESKAMRRYPRSVALEDRFADLLPEVLLGVDLEQFAQVAAATFRPKPVPTVGLDHLHAPPVSVQEEATGLLGLLKAHGAGAWLGFPDLVADCPTSLHVVARFLALLELFREKVLAFDQEEALGPLRVSWTGEEPVYTVMGKDYE
jgi:segregation and condensation protein A